MLKFQQKYFIESIPCEDVNPEKIRQKNYKFRIINNIEINSHTIPYTYATIKKIFTRKH